MTHIPAYRIIVYQAVDPASTPDTAQYAAGLFIGVDSNARWTNTAPTADQARANMEAFWLKVRKGYGYEPPKKGEAVKSADAAPEPVSAAADDGEVL